jgi:HD-GYP domain-containing protein (c-di-GMP phosphodiesterase class II)
MEIINAPTIDIHRLSGQFVESWIRMLEYWDKSAAEHSRRVARVAVQLARKRGWRDRELAALEWGAMLHDVGKICIPPNILLREGPLTDLEWGTVKRHPIYGFEILKAVTTMELSAGIVLCHHENWDGSGYPRNLKGEEIPPGARIVAVAEVWDALTSNPADRAMWPKQRVIAYVNDHSGRKFDPGAVAVFMDIVDTLS